MYRRFLSVTIVSSVMLFSGCATVVQPTISEEESSINFYPAGYQNLIQSEIMAGLNKEKAGLQIQDISISKPDFQCTEDMFGRQCKFVGTVDTVMNEDGWTNRYFMQKNGIREITHYRYYDYTISATKSNYVYVIKKHEDVRISR